MSYGNSINITANGLIQFSNGSFSSKNTTGTGSVVLNTSPTISGFSLSGSSSGSLALATQATASGTITFPNGDGTLATIGGTQSLTNKTLDNSNTITVKSGSFTLQDSTTTSKQARFVLSGITAGQTRSYTLQNATRTLAQLNQTQTFTAAQTFNNGFVSYGAGASFQIGGLSLGIELTIHQERISNLTTQEV